MNDYTCCSLFFELKKINQILWNIEDKIRIKEKNKEFDSNFIELARQVYYTNDNRNEIKQNINVQYNSTIYEIKDYTNYKV
jgi:hypothetical protein